MKILIVFGLLAILCIAAMVVFHLFDMDEVIFIPTTFLVISVMTITIGLSVGYSHKLPNILGKQDLIDSYILCPCEYHLDKVKKWNEDVNYGNNKWCRFKLDDRSEYLIDIDKLLKGGYNED